MATTPPAAPEELEFGALSREIMTILWAAGKPLSVIEVHNRLRRPNSENNTSTILSMLTRQGYLNRTKDGRTGYFAPKRTRVEYQAGWMFRAFAAGADETAVMEQFLLLLRPSQLAKVRALLLRSDDS